MKSNLDLINECDHLPPNSSTSHLYRLELASVPGVLFGYIPPHIVNKLQWPKERWLITSYPNTKYVTLLDSLSPTVDGRSSMIEETLLLNRDLQTLPVLRHLLSERTVIYGPDGEAVFMIRAGIAASLFGVLTYGVQMIVYVEDDVLGDGSSDTSAGSYRLPISMNPGLTAAEDQDQNPVEHQGKLQSKPKPKLRLWIPTRSSTRRTFPSMLDCTVGGTLTHPDTPLSCLIRESAEEACFSNNLIRQSARSCGTVNYISVSDERRGGLVGLICPEIQYVYELKATREVVPRPGDEEVEKFELLDVDEVQDRLWRGLFTPANAIVVLDFFLRHGIVTPEDERDYVRIVQRFHREFEMPTR